MMMQTITESGAGMAGAQSIHANIYATQVCLLKQEGKWSVKDVRDKTDIGITAGREVRD